MGTSVSPWYADEIAAFLEEHPKTHMAAGAHTPSLSSSTCAVFVTERLTPTSVSHKKCMR